jgi:hypothetical protein
VRVAVESSYHTTRYDVVGWLTQVLSPSQLDAQVYGPCRYLVHRASAQDFIKMLCKVTPLSLRGIRQGFMASAKSALGRGLQPTVPDVAAFADADGSVTAPSVTRSRSGRSVSGSVTSNNGNDGFAFSAAIVSSAAKVSGSPANKGSSRKQKATPIRNRADDAAGSVGDGTLTTQLRSSVPFLMPSLPVGSTSAESFSRPLEASVHVPPPSRSVSTDAPVGVLRLGGMASHAAKGPRVVRFRPRSESPQSPRHPVSRLDKTSSSEPSSAAFGSDVACHAGQNTQTGLPALERLEARDKAVRKRAASVDGGANIGGSKRKSGSSAREALIRRTMSSVSALSSLMDATGGHSHHTFLQGDTAVGLSLTSSPIEGGGTSKDPQPRVNDAPDEGDPFQLIASRKSRKRDASATTEQSLSKDAEAAVRSRVLASAEPPASKRLDRTAFQHAPTLVPGFKMHSPAIRRPVERGGLIVPGHVAPPVSAPTYADVASPSGGQVIIPVKHQHANPAEPSELSLLSGANDHLRSQSKDTVLVSQSSRPPQAGSLAVVTATGAPRMSIGLPSRPSDAGLARFGSPGAVTSSAPGAVPSKSRPAAGSKHQDALFSELAGWLGPSLPLSSSAAPFQATALADFSSERTEGPTTLPVGKHSAASLLLPPGLAGSHARVTAALHADAFATGPTVSAALTSSTVTAPPSGSGATHFSASGLLGSQGLVSDLPQLLGTFDLVNSKDIGVSCGTSLAAAKTSPPGGEKSSESSPMAEVTLSFAQLAREQLRRCDELQRRNDELTRAITDLRERANAKLLAGKSTIEDVKDRVAELRDMLRADPVAGQVTVAHLTDLVATLRSATAALTFVQ